MRGSRRAGSLRSEPNVQPSTASMRTSHGTTPRRMTTRWPGIGRQFQPLLAGPRLLQPAIVDVHFDCGMSKLVEISRIVVGRCQTRRLRTASCREYGCFESGCSCVESVEEGGIVGVDDQEPGHRRSPAVDGSSAPSQRSREPDSHRRIATENTMPVVVVRVESVGAHHSSRLSPAPDVLRMAHRWRDDEWPIVGDSSPVIRKCTIRRNVAAVRPFLAVLRIRAAARNRSTLSSQTSFPSTTIRSIVSASTGSR